MNQRKYKLSSAFGRGARAEASKRDMSIQVQCGETENYTRMEKKTGRNVVTGQHSLHFWSFRFPSTLSIFFFREISFSFRGLNGTTNLAL